MNLEILGPGAGPFFNWLWRTSWQASVVIGLVLVLQWGLGKKLSSRWRHALWIVVLIRLILPIPVESPVSIFNLFKPVAQAIPAEWTVPVPPALPAPPDELEGADLAPVPATPSTSAPVASWLPRIWLAGALGLFGYLLITNGMIGGRIRRQRPVTDPGILNLLEDCKQEMGVTTPLSVVETPAVGSPALLGFVRPRLLLPVGLTQNFSLAELRYLFLHELGHLKRWDIPLNWLATVPLVLHWFNPLVWYAFHRMRVDGELACDALALSYTQGQETQSYGKTLIKLLESFSLPAAGPGVVGIMENKNQMKERIGMIAKFRKTTSWPVLAAALFAVLAAVTLTDAQTGGFGVGTDPQAPPKIIVTSPQVGATDVDPALKEITVTFDRDMSGGFSWTGGGPEYPATPEGQKAKWRDKRTCVLPVKLEAGHYYRVGINSTSYRNFKSTAGVPALPSAIYFTTAGAGEDLKRKATKPLIVGLTPKNGAQDVDPAVTELRVTFNVPMGGGFSWTGGGPDFPPIPEGKKPFWTDGNKTCVLPVKLEPGHTYQLGLNSPSHKNFQSAGGVPLDPVRYSFKTRS